MSDSDSDEFEDQATRYQTKIVYDPAFPYMQLHPPDVIFQRWHKLPLDLKNKAGHMMHISLFWWHILLRQQENHPTTAWAVQVGFLDSNVSNDLSLIRLQRIEILECILKAMDKGCLSEELTRQMVDLSIDFNLDYDKTADAMRWLDRTGEPRITSRVNELGPRRLCFFTLRHVFGEYARYIQTMGCCKKKLLKDLSVEPDEWSKEKSEDMKNKGNEQFQRRKYDVAVKWYSKAIRCHPDNHFLYGNRALCYIRCEKFLKAVGDGKRATLLQPDWAKGHYRFCEALFLLGQHKKALEANEMAQDLCQTDTEGMKDLQQQHAKFHAEMEEKKGSLGEDKHQKATGVKKVQSQRPDRECRPEEESIKKTTASKEPEDSECHGSNGKSGSGLCTEDHSKASKESKSEMADRKTRRAEPMPQDKMKLKGKQLAGDETSLSSSLESLKGKFASAVQDAHVALADQRCRNAEQAFRQALDVLNSSTLQDMGISKLDKNILHYGHATALLEIGQPEELAEAEKLFALMKDTGERKFQCLVYYGMGRACLKENRFSKALKHFSDARQMVKRQITPGKLTWPTTKVPVPETWTEYLNDRLEESLQICKFPPKPDAVCSHHSCQGHLKIEIYFTDPDFKGFIRLVCCQGCSVEFHISCWKKLKAAFYSDKNDKDFLLAPCFTPDCYGKIHHIVIFGSTGIIKCEFECPVSKNPTALRPRTKQKCTSLKKLKAKEDRKLARKQHKQATSIAAPVEMEESPAIQVITVEESSRPWHIDEDSVLHQIDLNKELFRDETHSVSPFMASLKPWMDHDVAKGHQCLVHEGTEPKVLVDVVDMLLKRKNRVWARVFIRELSGCVRIKPRLLDWAQQLNNTGLKAADTFIDRYAQHILDLDLTLLPTFQPLQDILMEKFGTLLESFTFSSFLKEALAQERCIFVWTLEENRDEYQSLHSILDEYFASDSIHLVIKKTENENRSNSPIKVKSKHHKKKPKEPKPVFVISGMRAGACRDEDEEDFFSEEDSLVLLDSDPFSVPHSLRHRIADFEHHYTSTDHRRHYMRFLDNQDQTKETLYEYFAQILEEHGPLEANNQLLVGELENFPPEAQQKIHEAGGLKSFLLQSFRFVMTDNLIGLMKHAVKFPEAKINETPIIDMETNSHRLSLNPSAKEFHPSSQNNSVSNSIDSSEGTLKFSEIEQPHHCGSSILQVVPSSVPAPVPYYFCSHTLPFGAYGAMEGAVGHSSDDFMLDCNLDGTEPQTGTRNGAVTRTTTVKAFSASRVDVAINTEPYETFEKDRGDMTKIEKSNTVLEIRIEHMKDDCDPVKQKRKEDQALLENEVEDIRQKVEITNKELGLFQKKLEDEIKRDQQEKKENQETLKAIKAEIKALAELHESYSKEIKEKNKEYETRLEEFIDKSNQSAAEKMSLEDELKRYGDLRFKAKERSQAAAISILESRQTKGLRKLCRCVSDGRAIVQDFKDAAARYPTAALQSAFEDWSAWIQDAETKITMTKAQYKKQMELVRNGTKLSSLPTVSIPPAMPPPAMPLPAPGLPRSFSTPGVHTVVRPQQNGHLLLQPERMALTQTDQDESNGRPTTPSMAQGLRATGHISTFDKIIDRLHTMFPHYSKQIIIGFIKEVRQVNGGSLSNLSYEEVINRVAQLILDHQERTREELRSFQNNQSSLGADPGFSCTPPRSESPRSSGSAGTPPPSQVWRSLTVQQRPSSNALNLEDPCIICHEEMSQENICVLECRHSFHKECIKSWLKEQSTCPTCRDHALLPEDFPTLRGRLRKGDTTSEI
ncbi:E3 ubiquitin-protein ligase TTC3 [Denticeps clupeoides]|uniref:RING-type E3 ubiquitin transferase n=1 Tax=Denticeps clupeoides TaxID=299321 RepID=A0AAY4ENX3_9TELE|nr:E3 ubiquitin-protein ligase TTC3 [Denticeps clupeoides]XP_028840282.1 E3 ubiquitin-protein ligase TTC3 [Denticeps clupeoides]XP_028840283.1 E3 ubiquitin-protein ligase TTC3 [Denticeps clupeoides]